MVQSAFQEQNEDISISLTIQREVERIQERSHSVLTGMTLSFFALTSILFIGVWYGDYKLTHMPVNEASDPSHLLTTYRFVSER
jgi:hypothetical protein